jgi:hypothetical protein
MTTTRNSKLKARGGPLCPRAKFNPQVLFFMDGKFTASRRWSRRRRLLLQRLGKVLPRHGELTGSESDVQGIAVHLAARIMGEAAATLGLEISPMLLAV